MKKTIIITDEDGVLHTVNDGFNDFEVMGVLNAASVGFFTEKFNAVLKAESQEILNTPISEHVMSVRLANLLIRVMNIRPEIKTVGDLIKLSVKDLRATCNGFGKRTIRDLQDFLKKYNLELRQDN